MAVEQINTARVFTEKDWEAAGIEVSKVKTFHACRILVNGRNFLGEIESSPSVESTGFALKVRFLYNLEVDESNSSVYPQDLLIARIKHEFGSYNSEQLNSSDEAKIYNTFLGSPEQIYDEFDISLHTSKATSDVALNILLKKDRLEPQRLAEFIESKLKWKIEPITREDIETSI